MVIMPYNAVYFFNVYQFESAVYKPMQTKIYLILTLTTFWGMLYYEIIWVKTKYSYLVFCWWKAFWKVGQNEYYLSRHYVDITLVLSCPKNWDFNKFCYFKLTKLNTQNVENRDILKSITWSNHIHTFYCPDFKETMVMLLGDGMETTTRSI